MKIESKVERMVATISEDSTVLDAVKLMTDKFIGSVVVMGKEGVKGLFTERDLMMRVVGKGRDPAVAKIKDVMPKEIVKVSPEDTSDRCLELMKQHRCRHLLVFDGNQFIGIVSLRDMVAMMIEEKEALIERLQQFITG